MKQWILKECVFKFIPTQTYEDEWTLEIEIGWVWIILWAIQLIIDVL